MEIKHPWLLFLGLTLGPFMVGIDLLAVAIAIEPMTKALSINIATLQWFLSAYGIGNSSILVTAGRLADLHGKRKMLLIGLAIFILSSLAISLTSSPLLIIFARLIQGASGGILFVIAIATATSLFEGCKRTKWISGIMGLAGLGMVLGPVVGGFLIHHFSWRMIFWINIPIGILTMLLVFFYMPCLPRTVHKDERVDWIGVFLFTVTFVLLMIGISQGHAWGWMSLKVWSFFVGAILFGAFFVFVEKRVKWPLVEFSLFKVQNFLAGGLTGFVLFFAFTSWILIFGIYLERVMSLTPEQAGYIFLPFGLALLIVSTRMGKLFKYFGPKKLILSGFICGIIAFVGLALVPLFPSYTLMMIYFAFFGLCFVLVNSNAIPAALEYMPPSKVGLATGKTQMWRWLGGALGAVIISAIFMHYSAVKLEKLGGAQFHDVLVGEQSGVKLDQSVQALLNPSYHHGLVITMMVLAGLCFLALLVSIFFISDPKKK